MIAGVVLGAAAGLDRTAFGQTLLAHPLVAASLSGALAGVPSEGIRAGFVLWMLSSPSVPVGETRVRDWTTAAVVVPWCVPEEAIGADWGLALLVGVAVALAGGYAIEGIRDVARRAIESWRSRPAAERGDPARLHLGLTLLHGVRGAMVTTVAVVVGGAAVEIVPPAFDRVLAGIWMLAPLGLLPLLWRVHGDLGRARVQWTCLATGAAVAGVVMGFGGGAP